MASFSYPKDLLHSSIEDQWFPVSTRDSESTLTAVELAERSFNQRKSRILYPETPPVVIGRQIHTSRSSGSRGRRRSRSGRQGSSSAATPTNNNDTSTDSATTTNNTVHEGDEVSTIVQQRPPQQTPAAPTSLFWNRVSASGHRHSTGMSRTDQHPQQQNP